MTFHVHIRGTNPLWLSMMQLEGNRLAWALQTPQHITPHRAPQMRPALRVRGTQRLFRGDATSDPDRLGGHGKQDGQDRRGAPVSGFGRTVRSEPDGPGTGTRTGPAVVPAALCCGRGTTCFSLFWTLRRLLEPPQHCTGEGQVWGKSSNENRYERPF